ncbi:hypothetical protein BJ742DRAFT_841409 [Cladochytrium replicatum]|nr:hypothetical protein BJ742DRAFT_841409 [Cladochytrium replicatum]
MGNTPSVDQTTKPEHKRPLRIGILGAGPSGLTAALALESYAGDAVEVTIIDKNSGVSDYEGVEYAIQERAARALEKIGVKDAALQRGNPMTEFCFYDERRDKKQMSVQQDPKYCFEVFRQHFLIDLEAQLKTTKVVRNSLIDNISFPESGEVEVKLTQKGGDAPLNTSLAFDVVIACEGLHSPTRRQLFPDQSKVNEFDFHILYMLVEVKENEPAPKYFREIANGSYLQFNMGQNATNMFFPLSNNRIAMAISFNHDTQNKIWAEHGVEENKPWAMIDAATKKKIATTFAAETKVFDNLFTNLVELVPDWDSKKIYSWAMRDTDALQIPYAKEGNVILIGDAAHAMLPCLGLGASLAMEDAELLGESLAKFAKSNWSEQTLKADLQKQVFSPYASARYPVWADLIARGRIAIPNFAGQQTATGFRVAPYIPIPLVAFAFSIAEWIRDLIGRRGY